MARKSLIGRDSDLDKRILADAGLTGRVTIERFRKRETWLEARRSGVGASDAGIIVGASPWSTPLELWREKTADEPEEREPTEAMLAGQYMESAISDWFAEILRSDYSFDHRIVSLGKHTILRPRGRPQLLTTLDRVIVGDDRGPGVLEIKNISGFKTDEWAETAPEHYRLQVQHQMIVTGCAWGIIAVLLGGQNMRHIEIAADSAIADALVEAEERFWSYVVNRVQPPAVAADNKTIWKVHPRPPEGSTIEFDGRATGWDETIVEAKEEIKLWQAKVDEAEVRIKETMGNAEFGTLPSGASYSWKRETKHYEAKEAGESTTRVLRRKNPQKAKAQKTT